MVNSQFNCSIIDDWPAENRKKFMTLWRQFSYISHCSCHSGVRVFSRTAVTNFSLPIDIVQKASIPKSIKCIFFNRSHVSYHYSCLYPVNFVLDVLFDKNSQMFFGQLCIIISYQYNCNSLVVSFAT